MKRKILIVITTGFVPYGGLTTVMMNYYRAMDKSDLKIDFASTNEPLQELLDELHSNGSEYFNLGNRKKYLLRYVKNLKAVLKNDHYDVIHVNGNSATMVIELFVACTAGIKRRIAHVHNTTCEHMALNKLLMPIFEHCYTNACACSQKAGEWIFSNDKYEVLNNAIDLERYRFDSNKREYVREQYNIAATDKVVGHVGKMFRQKNHEFILDVFAEILKTDSHWKLMLVGDGTLREFLEEKAKKIGVWEKTIFCGIKKHTEKYYSAFDVIVFPSLWEGLPLSLIEAQASGLDGVISDLITSEVCVSKEIRQKSLSEGAAAWSNAVLSFYQKDRKNKSELNCQSLREAGFDIVKNAQTLKKMYL